MEELFAKFVFLIPLFIWLGVEYQNKGRWVRIAFGLSAILVVNVVFFTYSIKVKDGRLAYCRAKLIHLSEALDSNNLADAKSILNSEYRANCGKNV